MTLHVHLDVNLDDAALADLRARLDPAISLTTGGRPEPARYHIWVGGRPSAEALRASPNLQAVVVPWAGLPSELAALWSQFPTLKVHNLHHNAAATAETAVALLLAAAKFIVPLDRSLRRDDWRPRYAMPPVMLLDGRTALVLGYGAIGRRVARACHGLGLRVLATRRSRPTTTDDVAAIYAAAELPELLPRADALLITLPGTPETESLIGAAELALLPDEAVLVNVGRGPIVDEGALYGALVNGRLRAAGLDVWYNYPSDAASREATAPATWPFHTLDNVVMSPHRGGFSDRRGALLAAHLAETLNAAAAGRPLPHPVDPARGY